MCNTLSGVTDYRSRTKKSLKINEIFFVLLLNMQLKTSAFIFGFFLDL
jgi:hypothetical protein